MSQENVNPPDYAVASRDLMSHAGRYCYNARGDRALRAGGVALFLNLALCGAAAAQTGTLYNFTAGSDGAYPYGGVAIGAGGALYGFTAQGGAACGTPGCGTFYSVAPPPAGQTAWTESILYQFKGGSDGATPYSTPVANKKGVLFGTTAQGGNGNGTVFELTPPANGQVTWIETPIFAFVGIANGAIPYAGVTIGKKGLLYGTTYYGGSGPCTQNGTVVGCGIVYSLTKPAKGSTAWTESVLYSFQDGGDGGTPYAGVVEVKNDLYGTAVNGGNGHGTVFKLSPPAAGKTVWTEDTIYAFNGGSDGQVPYGGLIAGSTGVLYGTTSVGGTYGFGTVFSLTPPAKGSKAPWTEQILYNFAGGNISDGGLGTEFDGIAPYSSLIMDASGALYGTTQRGGYLAYGCDSSSGVSTDGCGTVFKLTPPASLGMPWTETVLYELSYCCDGYFPVAGLAADASGNFYGTAVEGGNRISGSGYGTVFKVTP
jgi:uncharacterized repeat protein (TIGR03803 family)